jgi:hypothetical protein
MMTKFISEILLIIYKINILIITIIKIIINKYKLLGKVLESLLIKADHLITLESLIINIHHNQDLPLHV